jgi:hypothetical protein
MIDSGSRSQVRPLESFKRSRFGLLAIASYIIHYPDEEATLGKTRSKRMGEHDADSRNPGPAIALVNTSRLELSRFAADAFACC